MHAGAAFAYLMLLCVMIVLYGVYVEYEPRNDTFYQKYAFFQDVHVMIFIGFGFLMSFLHKAGFTATGHAFLVAAYTVMWAPLVRGFWSRAVSEHQSIAWDNKIQLNLTELITADFTAGAVLISFGALLGRISASQLLALALWETVIYALNEAILVERLQVADIGGSMIIHTFGAYFGLAASFVLENVNWTPRKGKKPRDMSDRSAEGSSRVTDTMAMVGTLFLFCFWPSFNSAPAALETQQRTVVNTFLSISCSAIAGFLVTSLMDKKHKFGMVEAQNATIAGGVAIGASADMVVNPFGAMLVGLVGGTLSVVGYRKIQPALAKIGLQDTCGVHNLHGMPGVLAGIVAAIATGAARVSSYHATHSSVFPQNGRDQGKQAGYQLAALATTLAFALVGGALGGVILAQMPTLEAYFDDRIEYSVPDEEEGEEHAGDEEMKTVNEPTAEASA